MLLMCIYSWPIEKACSVTDHLMHFRCNIWEWVSFPQPLYLPKVYDQIWNICQCLLEVWVTPICSLSLTFSVYSSASILFNQAVTSLWGNPTYCWWQERRCTFSFCCKVETNYLDFFFFFKVAIPLTQSWLKKEMTCYFHWHVVVSHFKIHSQMIAETPWPKSLQDFYSGFILLSSHGFLIKGKFKAKRKKHILPFNGLTWKENAFLQP